MKNQIERKLVLISIILLSLSACVGGSGGAGVNEVLNDKVAELQFIDSRSFDSSLADALDERPWKVNVTPSESFSLNDIPERLDQWLFVVQDSGGTVKAVEEPEEVVRGGIPGGLGTVIEIARYAVEKRRLGKAKAYNVILLHDYDGRVRQVTFERR